MRDIEPDELSSSEWVRFLVMPETERERWMTDFRRRRRNSDESNSSVEIDRGIAHDKAEEARADAEESRRAETQALAGESSSAIPAGLAGSTAPINVWARHFAVDDPAAGTSAFRQARPTYLRRTVTEAAFEAPPTYDSVIRARTPPPAYEPRSDDEGPMSPRSP